MAARKTTRKKTPRSARSRARAAIDEGLRDFEKRIPQNLKSTVRELRSNLKALLRQADKLLAERDARWRKLDTQVRNEIVKVLRRIEEAVAPPGSGSKSSARKKSRRKPSARRKTTRKKTTRKKTARR